MHNGVVMNHAEAYMDISVLRITRSGKWTRSNELTTVMSRQGSLLSKDWGGYQSLKPQFSDYGVTWPALKLSIKSPMNELSWCCLLHKKIPRLKRKWGKKLKWSPHWVQPTILLPGKHFVDAQECFAPPPTFWEIVAPVTLYFSQFCSIYSGFSILICSFVFFLSVLSDIVFSSCGSKRGSQLL